jgi:hypothetical protein
MISLKMEEQLVNCQNPRDFNNISRTYKVIKCTFDNLDEDAKAELHKKALELAQQVHPGRANDSVNDRTKETLIRDAIGGMLAELGWLQYINSTYGEIANLTDFISASGQIDIQLNKGEKIEVRSSFPRNGLRFAICHDRHNFKNIGRYDNLYKPSEVPKDFFASVLFETYKLNLLISNEIVFYLIGGSTKEMMKDDSIAYNDSLVADDDIAQVETQYRLIKLKNALDIDGFNHYMQQCGY